MSANSSAISSWRLEVLLGREALRPALVAEHVALAMQTRASCAWKSSRVEELHRVRGDHRQLQLARRARTRARDQRLGVAAGRRAAARGSSGSGNSSRPALRAAARAASALSASSAWPTSPPAAPESAISPSCAVLASHRTRDLGAAAVLVRAARRATAGRTGADSRRATAHSSSSAEGLVAVGLVLSQAVDSR